MSSYIDFYVKRYGVYIGIGSFSRHSEIYQAFEGAPYGKIAPLKVDELEYVKSVINEGIEKYKKSIDKCNSQAEFLRSMDNPLTEKMSLYYEISEEITEWKQAIEDAQYALSYIEFLEIVRNDQYKPEEEEVLYYGVDAGNPMVLEYDQFGKATRRYKVEVTEEEVTEEEVVNE